VQNVREGRRAGLLRFARGFVFWMWLLMRDLEREVGCYCKRRLVCCLQCESDQMRPTSLTTDCAAPQIRHKIETTNRITKITCITRHVLAALQWRSSPTRTPETCCRPPAARCRRSVPPAARFRRCAGGAWSCTSINRTLRQPSSDSPCGTPLPTCVSQCVPNVIQFMNRRRLSAPPCSDPSSR
jgi:hypothetical protein